MKSDFKVATSAVFALLATVATVELGGNWGAGPSCLRDHGSAIQTKICVEKGATQARVDARKPEPGVDPSHTSAVRPHL